MTETEKKALALVNAVCAEWEVSPATEDDMDGSACFAALTRAIEQHEAFKREVSDAVEKALYQMRANQLMQAQVAPTLTHFIIPKPDPLVDAVNEAWGWRNPHPDVTENLRTALAARGLEVRKIGEGE